MLSIIVSRLYGQGLTSTEKGTYIAKTLQNVNNFFVTFSQGEVKLNAFSFFCLLQLFYTTPAARQQLFPMAYYLHEKSASSFFCSGFDFILFSIEVILQLANISESALM